MGTCQYGVRVELSVLNLSRGFPLVSKVPFVYRAANSKFCCTCFITFNFVGCLISTIRFDLTKNQGL